jgi:hypothetical protein
MGTQCTPEEEFDQGARGLFPTLLSFVNNSNLRRMEEYLAVYCSSAPHQGLKLYVIWWSILY